jgi:hypothetical protein
LNHILFKVVFPQSEFVFHANGNRPQDMGVPSQEGVWRIHDHQMTTKHRATQGKAVNIYRRIVDQHGRANKGYDVSSVPGLMDPEQKVFIKMADPPKGVTGESFDVLELCDHIRVTIEDGRRHRVVQACFSSRDGSFYIWYSQSNKLMRQRGEALAGNLAAQLLHQGIR